MNKNPAIPRFSPDGLLGLKEMVIATDILGSYTGVPADPNEVPVQDADDL